MQNFHATIHVAEDAAFRKTILDAVERVTLEQINKVLPDVIREVLERPEFKHRLESAAFEVVRGYVRQYVGENQVLLSAVSEEKEAIRSAIKAKFTDERVVEIMSQTVQEYVKARMKL